MERILNKLDKENDDVVLVVIHDILNIINKFSENYNELDFEINNKLQTDINVNCLISEIHEEICFEDRSQEELDIYSDELYEYLSNRLNMKTNVDTEALFEKILKNDDI